MSLLLPNFAQGPKIGPKVWPKTCPKKSILLKKDKRAPMKFELGPTAWQYSHASTRPSATSCYKDFQFDINPKTFILKVYPRLKFKSICDYIFYWKFSVSPGPAKSLSCFEPFAVTYCDLPRDSEVTITNISYTYSKTIKIWHCDKVPFN